MNDLDFRLCGARPIVADEPYPFLDQAYGALECVIAAVEHTGDSGPLNPTLIAQAIRGASTLVALAALGLARMDERTTPRVRS